MQRIVFLERGTFHADLEIPRPGFEHQWAEYEQTSADQVIERLADADIAIVNKVLITDDVLSQLPKLKMVAVAATGYNNVDLEACRKRGVHVNNVSGYAGNTVAEHNLMMLFALKRSLVAYQKSAEQHHWVNSPHFCDFVAPIRDLADTTIGIVGSGHIGDALAAKASALGMTVLKSERYGADTARPGHTLFNDVLDQADAVALCCPLTDDNAGMMNADSFKRMKSSAFLLNTSRGGLINEQDLVTAIENGEIAGAGLDVATLEPIRDDNPLLKLTSRPNFILTPHVAWGSYTAMATLLDGVMKNLENFTNGNTNQFLV
jgi:glycerate dehydrogenase